MKLKMLAEVTVPGADGGDWETREWLYRQVLRVGLDGSGLILHSNETGDTVGDVKVLGVELLEP